MSRKELIEFYSKRESEFAAKAGKESSGLIMISFLRLIVFIAGIALSVFGFTLNPAAGTGAVIISAALFMFLVKNYIKHTLLKEYYENLAVINRNEQKALAGDFSEFRDGKEWMDQGHDFSYDTDLFGDSSIFSHLNRTVTGYGRKILAGWLSDPLSCSHDLINRQETIKELAGKPDWRQDFCARGFSRSLEERDLRDLLEWLDQGRLFRRPFVFRLLIYALPLLATVTLLTAATGITGFGLFTIFFLVNLFIAFAFLKQTNRIHEIVSRKHSYLFSFTELLEAIRDEDFRSAYLSEIKNDITSDSGSPIKSIKALSRIIRRFDSRLNMMVGFILNGLFLWDLQCVNSLESWKKKSSAILPALLNHIGTLDAYISLAGYAFNNPGFAWPAVTDDDRIIEAVCMGHPLISDEKRVCNDVIIREGSITIITGANMAGKSTFLRTVAVNFILAMTGAPVCAAKMNFRPGRLFTSMRTTDSLSHNESYFYAELRRLKILKEMLESEKNVLFILDEILKGTNSSDKSRGSRLFIKKCISLNGTGLVATHDTSLAETEKEHPETIVNRCFEIGIEGKNVTFDYKLRDGITTRMNASLLMREMGITDQTDL